MKKPVYLSGNVWITDVYVQGRVYTSLDKSAGAMKIVSFRFRKLMYDQRYGCKVTRSYDECRQAGNDVDKPATLAGVTMWVWGGEKRVKSEELVITHLGDLRLPGV